MNERYQIVEPLAGAGGFGRVAKAFDQALERHVAIKILDPLFKASPSGQDHERFQREAKTLASLSHPSIPAIYDVQFDEPETDFRIIFEWIDGTTLRQWLVDRGTVSLDEARKWFANICGALAHAHSKGIVHRDIKPSNIIILPDASACYIVDFGISLRQADLERLTNGSPVGTPGYMSPEQERGEELDASSDIYSLGIVLYECLAGTRPSVGGYTSLNTFNEAIPPAIDDLVKQCLGDKIARPQSASAFLAALSQALTPHVSFADTLAQGSLFEIQLAIARMTASEFARLPKGQRVLIVSRLRDLINVGQENLRRATAQLLAGLVRAAQLQPDQDYGFIVEKALVFGYELQYGDQWVGNPGIRDSLGQVAIEAREAAHAILSDRTLAFLSELAKLEEKPKWYFHDLRILLQNLLANPQCSDDRADALGAELMKVNSLSHK